MLLVAASYQTKSKLIRLIYVHHTLKVNLRNVLLFEKYDYILHFAEHFV